MTALPPDTFSLNDGRGPDSHTLISLAELSLSMSQSSRTIAAPFEFEQKLSAWGAASRFRLHSSPSPSQSRHIFSLDVVQPMMADSRSAMLVRNSGVSADMTS
jgi:hypothetical protein